MLKSELYLDRALTIFLYLWLLFYSWYFWCRHVKLLARLTLSFSLLSLLFYYPVWYTHNSPPSVVYLLFCLLFYCSQIECLRNHIGREEPCYLVVWFCKVADVMLFFIHCVVGASQTGVKII